MNSDNKAVMQALHQRPIAYYKAHRDLTGSLAAAIALSQLTYWFSAAGRTVIYKQDAELREETGLTEREMRSAKMALKKLGFLKISLHGVPAKTHYEIDWELYAQALSEVEKHVQTSLDESSKLDMTNRPNQFGRIVQTNTETTEEITDREGELSNSLPGEESIFSSLRESGSGPLTIDEVRSIPGAAIESAIDKVIKTIRKENITRKLDKVRLMEEAIPITRIMHTILGRPINSIQDLDAIWSRWRRGVVGSTLPAEQLLNHAFCAIQEREIYDACFSLRDFLSLHDSRLLPGSFEY